MQSRAREDEQGQIFIARCKLAKMHRKLGKRISIDPDAAVEDIIEKYPRAVDFLMQRGIICIRCGAPVWGSLADLIKQSGAEVTETTRALQQYLEGKS